MTLFNRVALIAEVSTDIVDLPAHCHDLWERILTEDSARRTRRSWLPDRLGCLHLRRTAKSAANLGETRD